MFSACAGNDTTSLATPSSAVEEAAVLQTPTLKATSTPTPAAPTRTTRPTITPTVTETMSAVDAAARINLLLENLVTDLEDTEIIQEIEIP